MKKLGIVVLCIIIVIVAIYIGTLLFSSLNTTKDNANNITATNNIIENNINYSVKNDITIKTNTQEEKISPNATLILKRQYKECGHIIKKYETIPDDVVNLTKEELELKYEDWQIEEFTSANIVLIKEEDGFCDEHYILKPKDGLIAIYKIDEQGNEKLEEITGISIEYLTESDQAKINKGIIIYGREELNSIIEDYE